jgi:2-iminobutanoate/2-iminopropanoate deaminase
LETYNIYIPRDKRGRFVIQKGDIFMKVVSTDKAPAAIGPYSQAMILNGVVFTSGQIPIDPATGEITAKTIEEQAEQVMKNLGEVLKEAGSSYEKTVKTTCFLSDMGDFAAFNEIYGKYFTGKPARSCVAVKTLPKNVLCEVEAIAEI